MGGGIDITGNRLRLHMGGGIDITGNRLRLHTGGGIDDTGNRLRLHMGGGIGKYPNWVNLVQELKCYTRLHLFSSWIFILERRSNFRRHSHIDWSGWLQLFLLLHFPHIDNKVRRNWRRYQDFCLIEVSQWLRNFKLIFGLHKVKVNDFWVDRLFHSPLCCIAVCEDHTRAGDNVQLDFDHPEVRDPLFFERDIHHRVIITQRQADIVFQSSFSIHFARCFIRIQLCFNLPFIQLGGGHQPVPAY